MTVTSLELRKAIRSKYAWPGGYEIFGVTSDGAVLCCDCMKDEYKQIAYARRHHLSDGWRVDAVDCTANTDGRVECDHCNKLIQEDAEADCATFEYFINLDERGEFAADVRDAQGATVLEVSRDLIEDGYMRHKDDIDGLRDYLLELGIMADGDAIVKGN